MMILVNELSLTNQRLKGSCSASVTYGLQTKFKGLWISTLAVVNTSLISSKTTWPPDQITAYCSSKLSTINKNLKMLSAKIEETPSLSTKYARYSAATYIKKKIVASTQK